MVLAVQAVVGPLAMANAVGSVALSRVFLHARAIRRTVETEGELRAWFVAGWAFWRDCERWFERKIGKED